MPNVVRRCAIGASLEMFVGIVDEQLFKGIDLKDFETKNVQQTYKFSTANVLSHILGLVQCSCRLGKRMVDGLNEI